MDRRLINKNIIIALICVLLPTLLCGEVEYVVEFKGVPTGKTLELMRDVSDLVQMRPQPPHSVAGLRRRAQGDIPAMEEVMRSRGFYEASIAIDVDERKRLTVVTVDVDTGPEYLLGPYVLLPAETDSRLQPDPELDLSVISLTDIGLKPNQPAWATDVLDSQEQLIKFLGLHGYPLAAIEGREIVVDQSANTLAVTLQVNSGPWCRFGETQIAGLDRVDEAYIRGRIRWKQGEQYTTELVDKTNDALLGTYLFATITITPSGLPGEDHLLPMLIEVSEDKHRSLGVGVSFQNELGPGASIEWEHRNVGGVGERIRLLAEADLKEQRLRAAYRKPDFLELNQDLLLVTEYKRERTDGPSGDEFLTAATLERKVNDRFSYSYGGSLAYIDPAAKSDIHADRVLLSIPIWLRWSSTNDPLNPVQGATFRYLIRPTSSLLDTGLIYLTQELAVTVYLPLTTDQRWVLAAKSTLASIGGSGRAAIPSQERFYAGTESLLRGYRHKTVSPLNSKNRPVGGRSMLISSVEARYRASEKIGWVAFYDMGNVYANPWPDLSQTVLQSVGLGFRYYTPVGPVRVDLALPLNARKGVDDGWEIYLNIGQAF